MRGFPLLNYQILFFSGCTGAMIEFTAHTPGRFELDLKTGQNKIFCKDV